MAVQHIHNRAFWTGRSLQVRAESRDHALLIDEPRTAGGEDTGMTPVELLLASLSSCLVVTALMFAPRMGLTLEALSADIIGDLDTDGVLGLREGVRPGLQRLAVRITIESDGDAAAEQRLMDLVESRCPVTDSLRAVGIELELVR